MAPRGRISPSTAASLSLGVVSFASVVPRIVPVLALAFGASALLEEFRRPERRRSEIVFASLGLLLGGLYVGMMLYRTYFQG